MGLKTLEMGLLEIALDPVTELCRERDGSRTELQKLGDNSVCSSCTQAEEPTQTPGDSVHPGSAKSAAQGPNLARQLFL